MTGKHHIIVNTASLIGVVGSFTWLLNTVPDNQYQAHTVLNHISVSLQPGLGVPFVPFVLLCFVLFILGTVLPDIDSPNSIAGKYIHLPIAHRTWTHAIWLPIVLFVASLWSNLFFWVGFGYLLHLFWDSLSQGGVCFLYPFSRYNQYRGGAQTKKKHFFKLYRVGGMSENVLVVLIITFSVAQMYIGVTSSLTTTPF